MGVLWPAFEGLKRGKIQIIYRLKPVENKHAGGGERDNNSIHTQYDAGQRLVQHSHKYLLPPFAMLLGVKEP